MCPTAQDLRCLARRYSARQQRRLPPTLRTTSPRRPIAPSSCCAVSSAAYAPDLLGQHDGVPCCVWYEEGVKTTQFQLLAVAFWQLMPDQADQTPLVDLI